MRASRGCPETLLLDAPFSPPWMSDDDRRPLGDRSAGRRAIGLAAVGASLCLGLVLVAVGWMGSDRPLTLASMYVTAPPGAVFCFYRAVVEARSASGRRPRRHDR